MFVGVVNPLMNREGASQAICSITPFQRFRSARPDSAMAWYQPLDSMKPRPWLELPDLPTGIYWYCAPRGNSGEIYGWSGKVQEEVFKPNARLRLCSPAVHNIIERMMGLIFSTWHHPPPKKQTNTQSESNSFATNVGLTKKCRNNMKQHSPNNIPRTITISQKLTSGYWKKNTYSLLADPPFPSIDFPM